MARLDDLLARWLLRRATSRSDGINGSSGHTDAHSAQLKALQAHAAQQTEMVQRMKETADKRNIRHKELRKRVVQLKRELKQMKAQARHDRHEAWDWETRYRLMSADLRSYEDAVHRSLTRRGCIVAPVLEDPSRVKRFLRLKDKVWRTEMRLGVLRQHDPRPLKLDTIPNLLPPGPPESWPLISMVTPSYQQADFLERTMQSILGQNYPRLDYHVWDGGSKDGSVDIIQRHADKLASWGSEKDTGPASAINKGFLRSKGEIMAWLNSDDLLTPGTLHYVANYFATHPEVDAIYGHRLIVNERDWQVGRWVLPPHNGEMLLWGDYIPQETLFWRRSLWEKSGGHLDESFKFAFDWDLLLRFQRAGARIQRLPWFLGCFRVHELQKSSAEITTTGFAEMARLRTRELGTSFTEERLGRHVVLYQAKAAWCDRLLRWRIRW
jgi:glycosyltransferase involved in cell wall biosynthesis